MKIVDLNRPSARRRRKVVAIGALAVVFIWGCLPARPFRPVEPLPAKITDMHCHIAGVGAGDSGCFVSPRLRNNWRFSVYLARLEWAKAQGAVLIKWIPPIMEINPDDSKLVPFYKKMAKLHLPLLSHTGEEGSFSRADEEFGDPEKLRLPLSQGVTVIAAHIASSEKYQGERGPDRLARLMREYPNLYTDISALTQINKPGVLKEALTRPEFSGRLLYGTDFPLINTALVSPWYSFHLSLRQKWSIWRTKNPWDRDVMMKHDLGAPADTFARPEEWFNHPQGRGSVSRSNVQTSGRLSDSTRLLAGHLAAGRRPALQNPPAP